MGQCPQVGQFDRGCGVIPELSGGSPRRSVCPGVGGAGRDRGAGQRLTGQCNSRLQKLNWWVKLETGVGSKVGQIGPKWDKSRTFSDQISVHFGSAKSDRKKVLDLSHSYLI